MRFLAAPIASYWLDELLTSRKERRWESSSTHAPANDVQ
jgi:hypothetical protein